MLSAQDHFRIISETASDAIVTIDETSIILFANPAAGRLFGYDVDELIGKPLSVLMPQRMRASHHAGVARHARTGERHVNWRGIELPGLHRDGHELMLEVSFGDYMADGRHYYTGIMRDITERLQVQRRLNAEQDVMRILAIGGDTKTAVHQVLEKIATRFDWDFGALWAINTRDNTLECYETWQAPDASIAEFVGATCDTFLNYGQGLPGRVWASNKAVWIRDIAADENFPRLRTARENQLRAAFAFPVRQANEILGVIEFFGKQTLDPDPSLLAMSETLGTAIGQFFGLRRTLEELQRANHVKSDFLATMSHELRTPLNAMIGFSQLLLDGIPTKLPADAEEKVYRISMSAKHLLGLIEEILSFSRLEAGEESLRLAPADPREIAVEVKELLEPLAHEKGLTLEYRMPDPVETMVTDPVKVRQILVNLVGNAIKFTTQGGVTLQIRNDQNCVAFDVIDTGPGISPEYQEKIFEPFWQVETGRTRNVTGTGLGLTVTQRLAKFLGGDISVESQPGHGTTFRVRIPKRASA